MEFAVLREMNSMASNLLSRRTLDTKLTEGKQQERKNKKKLARKNEELEKELKAAEIELRGLRGCAERRKKSRQKAWYGGNRQ